jgi:hypothetical protein
MLFVATEKRLQAQGLADGFSIQVLVIEAGEPYFEGSVRHVGEVLESATKEIACRDPAPYASKKK